MSTTKTAVIIVAATATSFLLTKNPIRDRVFATNAETITGNVQSPVAEISGINPEARDYQVASDEDNTKDKLALRKELGVITFKRQPASGIVFRVQVLASQTHVPLDSKVFRGYRGIREYSSKGIYKYTLGGFKTPRQSEPLFSELEDKGFHDTFLVAFNDDQPMKVKDAMISIGKTKATPDWLK